MSAHIRVARAITDGLPENWTVTEATERLTVVERTDAEHYLTIRAATHVGPAEYDLTLMDDDGEHAIPLASHRDTVPGLASKITALVETSHDRVPPTEEDAPPRYTRIDPRCPDCGTTKYLEPGGEGGDSMDAHFIDYHCTGCDGYLTVELAAIDVLVRDETGDVVKSGVSSGDIIPRTHEYPDPANYE